MGNLAASAVQGGPELLALSLPTWTERLREFFQGSCRRDAIGLLKQADLTYWSFQGEPGPQVGVQAPDGQVRVSLTFDHDGCLSALEVCSGHGAYTLAGDCPLATALYNLAKGEFARLLDEKSEECIELVRSCASFGPSEPYTSTSEAIVEEGIVQVKGSVTMLASVGMVMLSFGQVEAYATYPSSHAPINPSDAPRFTAEVSAPELNNIARFLGVETLGERVAHAAPRVADALAAMIADTPCNLNRTD